MLDQRRFVWVLVSIAPMLAGVTCGFNEVEVEEKTLTTELQGEQVVPPVETSATGTVTARLFGNNLALQGSFKDLSSPVLANEEGAVLLRLAPAGETGPILAAAPAASLDGRTGSFELTTLIEDDVVDAFLEGETYVELRTADHPDGEVRAQLE